MDNHVMLTGAGFTSNFGAPLARDMATAISNNLDDKDLKTCIRANNFDYERAYQNVLEENIFTERQKVEMSEAVRSAYRSEIDNVILGASSRFNTTIHWIEKFFDKVRKPFFIFTLNQDLFLERSFWGWREIQYDLTLPAANCKIAKENRDTPLVNLYVNNDFRVNNEEFEKQKVEFNRLIGKIREGSNSMPLIAYVKLHGSMDWTSDGTEQLMIIGGNKESHIQKYPLLQWYYEMFKNEVSKDNTKLLIIGYGFGDEHINSVLRKSILEKNLQLYIINPTKQIDFENDLKNKQWGNIFNDAIKKYYPHNLSTLFPNDPKRNESSHWRKIENEYLGNEA